MEDVREIRKNPLKTGLFTAIVILLGVLSQAHAETADTPLTPIAANERLYAIDSAASIVHVHVRRGGLLRRAGHDHVVTSETIEGFVVVTPDRTGSRAESRLPLEELIVDDPQHRSQFGLEAEVSESSIQGTTSNMQNKVLEVDDYPWMEVSAVVTGTSATSAILDVTIMLHGAEYDYEVPVEFEIDEERLSVSGEMSIAQTHFGIRPFRAAAGLLRVADRLDIEFEIVARSQDDVEKVD